MTATVSWTAAADRASVPLPGESMSVLVREADEPLTGLVLSGGGARAAYQVGVLKALVELLPEGLTPTNPFPIIVGTSAGAINATALASGADNFREAVRRIVAAWENIRPEQVYHTDPWGLGRTGAHWLSALAFNWLRKRALAKPRGLLDNAPLAGFLAGLIDPQRINRLLHTGALEALAISASSYTSGQHVTYYQSHRRIEPWTRSQRVAIQEDITIEHLLASSAIPFVFPARALQFEGRLEYFGDGSMRQLSPISPAIHLGASRVLVVGVGRLQEPPLHNPQAQASYPSIAQIAGHALSSIFLDGLSVDIERLLRINRTLQLLPPEGRSHSSLRPVEVLLISPTQRLDEIAARHVHNLPPMVRALLRGVGATDVRGATLASYLLFESGYTRELIDLGYADTVAKSAEVLRFFGGT
jgi:NTE family protein